MRKVAVSKGKQERAVAKQYKLADIVPAKRWAEISEDVPPEIWGTSSYREHLRQDLRHIQVLITPIAKKRPAKKANKR